MPGPAATSSPSGFLCFKSHLWDVRSRLVASDSCPGPEFFSKFPFHSHPKRKSRRQMSAACACSSLAVGSTAIAAAPRPHPRLGPERADDRHQPQHSILRSGRHLPTQAPCGHAARPTQSGTNGHMQTESRDSFIAPWEVTVGDRRIVAVCAVAGGGAGGIPEAQGRNSVSQPGVLSRLVAWEGGNVGFWCAWEDARRFTEWGNTRETVN